MTAVLRSRVRVLVVGAVLALLLSSCATSLGREVAGPGMTHRMGQGSIRCADAAPHSGTTVDVVLMDMGRHSSMSRHGRARMLGGPARMPAGGARMPAMMRHGRMMLAAAPRVVPAGQVTFVAVNRGARRHELVVLPLASDTPAGRRLVGADAAIDESASLGEASRSCGSGEGDGIEPGTVGWVTLALTPGRYELVCNRAGHYARGMYAELVVR